MTKAILLLSLWAFMSCSKMNFYLFTLAMNSKIKLFMAEKC